jgi:hypothetical protein
MPQSIDVGDAPPWGVYRPPSESPIGAALLFGQYFARDESRQVSWVGADRYHKDVLTSTNAEVGTCRLKCKGLQCGANFLALSKCKRLATAPRSMVS